MQGSKLGILPHQFASRLNAHSQTDWAIEDQAKLEERGRDSHEIEHDYDRFLRMCQFSAMLYDRSLTPENKDSGSPSEGRCGVCLGT